MVRAVPDVPAAARAPARRPAATARSRPLVHPVPARRPDRGARRLPRGPARGRAAPRRARRRRPAPGRAVDGPHGRVHGLGRDHRPRPPARPGPRRRSSAARCAVGYLPDMFGHVAQMPQILRLAGLEHAVVWRGVPAASTRPRSGGKRPTARACAPSTSTARTRTAATSPTTPTQLVARARGYEPELGRRRARPAAACC